MNYEIMNYENQSIGKFWKSTSFFYPQVQADCLFNSPNSRNFFAFSWRQKRNAIPQAWFGSILKNPLNLIFILPREPAFGCWKMFSDIDPPYCTTHLYWLTLALIMFGVVWCLGCQVPHHSFCKISPPCRIKILFNFCG